MKKIFFLIVIAITIASCKKEPNNFVTFSGEISNKNSDSIVIFNPQLKFNKVIKVDKDGNFKDTLNVKDGFYQLFDGKEYSSLYLKNGATINMKLNAKEFDESITFAGQGANESIFLAESSLLQEKLVHDENLFKLPKKEFETKINDFATSFNKRIQEKKLDSTFIIIQEKSILGLKKQLNRIFNEKLYLATNLAKGMPSPTFIDYENHKKGTTSLNDFKGKYVYIDVWATWCNPCKKEIPYLQKVEKKYHDKNIEFVSLSVDSKKDHDAWRKMVSKKQLTGIQLFADNSWQSKFVAGYVINSIPRFILIDPEGNIVSSNAPRPSSPELIKLFDSLSI